MKIGNEMVLLGYLLFHCLESQTLVFQFENHCFRFIMLSMSYKPKTLINHIFLQPFSLNCTNIWVDVLKPELQSLETKLSQGLYGL